MGLLDFIKKNKKSRKCIGCGMEDQQAVSLMECSKCKSALCGRCSMRGLCQLCHRLAMRESEDTDTSSYYDAPAAPNAESGSPTTSKPTNTQNPVAVAGPTCARCQKSGPDPRRCMTCEVMCCSGCGDATVPAPYRRCAFCPPPVGGDHTARRHTDSSFPIPMLNECCICRCACPTGPASQSAEGPTPPCRLMGAEYGHCFRCCRVVCFDCSVDSGENCFKGELLCTRCRPQFLAETFATSTSIPDESSSEDKIILALLAQNVFDATKIPEDSPADWVAHSLRFASSH
eukprot:GILI01029516.1.p1 GENE.GILI01029516.1~~GILI01029516.1.p1  ORF type:complete len:288 (+),score=9.88 GILI01029516.1:60-923(+)